MAHTFEQLHVQWAEHNRHRRHFDRLPEEVAQQIQQEAIELIQEIQTSLLTGDVFSVVGEIGDIYILLSQLCDDLGINPVEAFNMKALRNERKYPDWTMNNGYSRETAVNLSKELWRDVFGGDALFSHAYLDYLADAPEE